jgi:hypothetical protein
VIHEVSAEGSWSGEGRLEWPARVAECQRAKAGEATPGGTPTFPRVLPSPPARPHGGPEGALRERMVRPQRPGANTSTTFIVT